MGTIETPKVRPMPSPYSNRILTIIVCSYVGEVGLWAAQFLGSTTVLAAPAVAGPLFPAWMAYAAVSSPVLEYCLIRFISGVPMLE